MDAEAAVARARDAVARAVSELSSAGAADEALAEWVPRRRMLGVARRPVLRPRGRVWRLGTLLLGADGALYAAGTATRVTEPGRPQNLHGSVEERRSQRAAALAAGYRVGDVVNHGAVPIVLEASELSDPRAVVALRDGGVSVRWSRTGDPVPFERYLAERVELLEHPPAGA